MNDLRDNTRTSAVTLATCMSDGSRLRDWIVLQEYPYSGPSSWGPSTYGVLYLDNGWITSGINGEQFALNMAHRVIQHQIDAGVLPDDEIELRGRHGE